MISQLHGIESVHLLRNAEVWEWGSKWGWQRWRNGTVENIHKVAVGCWIKTNIVGVTCSESKTPPTLKQESPRNPPLASLIVLAIPAFDFNFSHIFFTIIRSFRSNPAPAFVISLLKASGHWHHREWEARAHSSTRACVAVRDTQAYAFDCLRRQERGKRNKSHCCPMQRTNQFWRWRNRQSLTIGILAL